jgi:hypothetical protein
VRPVTAALYRRCVPSLWPVFGAARTTIVFVAVGTSLAAQRSQCSGQWRIPVAAAEAASAAACRKLRMASRCPAGIWSAIALIRAW